MDPIIGIVGIGFVGFALLQSFTQKGYILNETLFVYDKYKIEYSTNFNDLFKCGIIFLTLPTLYNLEEKKYDLNSIHETLIKLQNYERLIVIKSTVEPNTCEMLCKKYKLNIIHNPEFLTARTALDDFNNQKHIIIGVNINYNDNYKKLFNFYRKNYPDANISVCSMTESELTKLFLNSFYAVKVQFFTEIYLLCNKLNVNYNDVKNMMLKNNWINPMHTTIPGPDGNISYGGMCFPKDTNALCNFMENNYVNNSVLRATINERNLMRE